MRPVCCARAVSGHTATAPPRSVMNSRLRMGLPTLGTLREAGYRIGGDQSGAARSHFAIRRDPRRQMWVKGGSEMEAPSPSLPPHIADQVAALPKSFAA